MSYLQTEVISHTRKICSLFKRAARLTQDHCTGRAMYRYEVTVLRGSFEENRHLKDTDKIQTLIDDAEKQLFLRQHYTPMKFANSPGGIAYGRELKSPDWVLDLWAPEEKAQYPEYFARREQRKKEYLTYWEKKFGVKAEEPNHH